MDMPRHKVGVSNHKRSHMASAERLVKIGQAADVLLVSERTVRRYIAAGHLTGVRVGPRLIRVTRESLDAMMTAGV